MGRARANFSRVVDGGVGGGAFILPAVTRTADAIQNAIRGRSSPGSMLFVFADPLAVKAAIRAVREVYPSAQIVVLGTPDEDCGGVATVPATDLWKFKVKENTVALVTFDDFSKPSTLHRGTMLVSFHFDTVVCLQPAKEPEKVRLQEMPVMDQRKLFRSLLCHDDFLCKLLPVGKHTTAEWRLLFYFATENVHLNDFYQMICSIANKHVGVEPVEPTGVPCGAAAEPSIVGCAEVRVTPTDLGVSAAFANAKSQFTRADDHEKKRYAVRYAVVLAYYQWKCVHNRRGSLEDFYRYFSEQYGRCRWLNSFDHEDVSTFRCFLVGVRSLINLTLQHGGRLFEVCNQVCSMKTANRITASEVETWVSGVDRQPQVWLCVGFLLHTSDAFLREKTEMYLRKIGANQIDVSSLVA